MRYKQFGNKVFVRIDKGEEIVETVKKICVDLGITLGTITGIGATAKAKIGLFDVETKKYHVSEVVGDHEIAPLYGNITTMNGDVYLHFHINLCDAEHRSFGGHLTSAVVSATFEGVIDRINGRIEREFNEKSGLNLLNIS